MDPESIFGDAAHPAPQNQQGERSIAISTYSKYFKYYTCHMRSPNFRNASNTPYQSTSLHLETPSDFPRPAYLINPSRAMGAFAFGMYQNPPYPAMLQVLCQV